MRIKKSPLKSIGKSRNFKGLTLIELIIAITLVALIFSVAGNFMFFSQKMLANAASGSQAKTETQLAIGHIQRNVKTGFALEVLNPTTLQIKKLNAAYSGYPEPAIFQDEANFKKVKYALINEQICFYPDAALDDYEVIASGIGELTFEIAPSDICVRVSIKAKADNGASEFQIMSHCAISSGRIS